MIEYRCKDCRWWDNREQFIRFLPEIIDKSIPGFCRRRRAGAIRIDKVFLAVHPVSDAEEFCGEFKGEI